VTRRAFSTGLVIRLIDMTGKTDVALRAQREHGTIAVAAGAATANVHLLRPVRVVRAVAGRAGARFVVVRLVAACTL